MNEIGIQGLIRRDKLTKGGWERRTIQQVNLVEIEGRGGDRIDEALSDVTMGGEAYNDRATWWKGFRGGGGRICV